MPDNDHTQLLVLGGGPGGYPAAFLAADLGLSVTLVDLRINPGGVCLYQGCIPSKTLLHLARLMHEVRDAADMGLTWPPPRLDLDRVRQWRDRVVAKLTGGLGALGKSRKVRFLRGRGRFIDQHTAQVLSDDGSGKTITFDQAIIATGSAPAKIPGWPYDSPALWTSDDALALPEIPPSLLVVGGGYIGLEMGTVYAALGSRVTVVEATGSLLPGADRDLVRPLHQRLEKTLDRILLNTRVESVQPTDDGKVQVELLGLDLPQPRRTYDRVLVCIGRRPNSSDLGLEDLGIAVDKQGFITTDRQRRTNCPHIFAIGDVAGQPMLAHKATYEGRIAAEVAAGKPSAFDPTAIPAVVFTDPEVAWAGLTEDQCKSQAVPHKTALFPWAASGRAATVGRSEGMTKVIVDPHTRRLLGIGICGLNAGELLAEGVLAIEMGATIDDIAMTIHAHPTLSETFMEAADLFDGTSAHYIDRKKSPPA